MIPNKFTDKDTENLVKLLNFVGEKARFELGAKDVIELFGLLAWAQQDLKKKIEANVFEVKNVYEAPEPEPEPKKPTRRSRAKKA